MWSFSGKWDERMSRGVLLPEARFSYSKAFCGSVESKVYQRKRRTTFHVRGNMWILIQGSLNEENRWTLTHRGVQEQTMKDMTFNSSSEAWERFTFGRQFGAATSFNARHTWVLSCTFLLIMTWPFVCIFFFYTKYETVQMTARSCSLVYTLVGFA